MADEKQAENDAAEGRCSGCNKACWLENLDCCGCLSGRVHGGLGCLNFNYTWPALKQSMCWKFAYSKQLAFMMGLFLTLHYLLYTMEIATQSKNDYRRLPGAMAYVEKVNDHFHLTGEPFLKWYQTKPYTYEQCASAYVHAFDKRDPLGQVHPSAGTRHMENRALSNALPDITIKQWGHGETWGSHTKLRVDNKDASSHPGANFHGDLENHPGANSYVDTNNQLQAFGYNEKLTFIHCRAQCSQEIPDNCSHHVMDYYFYHVTNPDAVLNSKAAPKMVRKGPYAYNIYHRRYDLKFKYGGNAVDWKQELMTEYNAMESGYVDANQQGNKNTDVVTVFNPHCAYLMGLSNGQFDNHKHLLGWHYGNAKAKTEAETALKALETEDNNWTTQQKATKWTLRNCLFTTQKVEDLVRGHVDIVKKKLHDQGNTAVDPWHTVSTDQRMAEQLYEHSSRPDFGKFQLTAETDAYDTNKPTDWEDTAKLPWMPLNSYWKGTHQARDENDDLKVDGNGDKVMQQRENGWAAWTNNYGENPGRFFNYMREHTGKFRHEISYYQVKHNNSTVVAWNNEKVRGFNRFKIPFLEPEWFTGNTFQTRKPTGRDIRYWHSFYDWFGGDRSLIFKHQGTVSKDWNADEFAIEPVSDVIWANMQKTRIDRYAMDERYFGKKTDDAKFPMTEDGVWDLTGKFGIPIRGSLEMFKGSPSKARMAEFDLNPDAPHHVHDNYVDLFIEYGLPINFKWSMMHSVDWKPTNLAGAKTNELYPLANGNLKHPTPMYTMVLRNQKAKQNQTWFIYMHHWYFSFHVLYVVLFFWYAVLLSVSLYTVYWSTK